MQLTLGSGPWNLGARPGGADRGLHSLVRPGWPTAPRYAAHSRAYNPLVVQGLSRRGFMDDRASGIARMTRRLAEAGQPGPVYRQEHDALVLELRPAPLREPGIISTKICAQRLGIPTATAKRHLADLVAEGVLRQVGMGKATHYRLTESKSGGK